MSASSNLSVENPAPQASRHHVRPGEIAVGVIIGRIGEFFDFFVYGIASALVFPGLFFPFTDVQTGLFYSFLIFSLGFIGRPLGALAFRFVHDRYGRATKLTSALLLLGTATVCIAFLPGYEKIGGVVIAVLSVLRLLQGIAVGGAWDGLPSLLAVTSPREKRGWYAMMAQIGAPLGFLVAVSLFAYLYHAVPEGEFLQWGWRFAFFTAFAINVVTLFARLRMSVTPEYEALFREGELVPSPLGDLFRTQWQTIALGALAPLASFALINLVTIYPLAWVLLKPDQFSLTALLALQTAGSVLCLGSMIVSGWIADRLGRDRMLFIGAVLIALFTLPAPILGETTFGAWAFILAGFALLGFSLAQSAGALNNAFDPEHRYSGALVTHEIGWLLGAGFAPFVALFLGTHYGEGAVAMYLLSGAIATLVALQLYTWRIQPAEAPAA
ncbi:MAG: MFS transporter [Salinisphaeraceae bacterium]|nr:MFS transporter [Salinisphaeraceae bacterium]